ncbi:MAG TPA: thymidine phosphorylase [candidate division Zixibacteria bacterium]|nr:thymidine phosphorylase [candidate division Zixibacteria bacterium]HBZ01571.1 thymidine phosphorylase [candidate division Zixibacteria bacterium]
MNPVEIIAKKRDGKKLTRDEISYFISLFLKGDIKDYQMSALLMAIFLKGMDYEETGWLTEIMLYSGETISFGEPRNLYVDKHSTGGVGDKVSLILAPWVAACGVKVPMLSGRGLGHTGGTLDKLETIPGYRTNLSLNEFMSGVENVGCVISGQTPEIAPADKAIYALRDVTSTVESIPLICGSILSKKFAAGPNGLVFDVKCGNGAFMKTVETATELAINLIGVCKAMGRDVCALLTDMNQPLGYTAGNILEVKESVDALKGNFAPDLYRVTIELAVEMLILAGISKNRETAVSLLETKLGDGSAWRKFEDMVAYQGGNLGIFEYSEIPKAPVIRQFKSEIDGFLQGFETEAIGRLIVDMGGGRKTKDDIIDPLVGLIFHKKIGDTVKAGEMLVEIHSRNNTQADDVALRLIKFIKIGLDKVEAPTLIKKRLS